MSSTRTSTIPQQTFPGVGRRVDGNLSSGLLSAPLAPDERYVLDAHAPTLVPKEKASFATKWKWHPKGTEGEFDLGKIGVVDSYTKLKWGTSGAMVESEIHLIYLPHLPVELYRDQNIEVVLEFDGADDDGIRIMAKAVFPSPLHTHIIFFPGHSFSVKPGSRFPWRLRIATTADIREDYPIADIIINYKGYNTPLSQYSEKTGANIISLVPVSEVPTGVVLTRPRLGGDWKVHATHFGIKHQKDIAAILSLQEAGLDVEGIQISGKLKEAIKVVNKIGGAPTEVQMNTEKHAKIRTGVAAILKS